MPSIACSRAHMLRPNAKIVRIALRPNTKIVRIALGAYRGAMMTSPGASVVASFSVMSIHGAHNGAGAGNSDIRFSGVDGNLIIVANAGHDTRALQAWRGHRNIQHTVRYTELPPNRFRAGAPPTAYSCPLGQPTI